MRRMIVSGTAALACWAALSAAGFGRVMAPAPIHQRVATSECVVVGKVTAIEDKPVVGKKLDTTAYSVAVVKIDEALYGAKGLTHLKVGFVPQTGGRGRFPQLNLQVGQEACFFLKPHPEVDIKLAPMYFDVVDKTSAEFKKDVELARRCGKLLADPAAGLKAKEADDRLLTAAMLVARYRTPSPFQQTPPKLEPIDAEQSKQILQVLADADWTRTNADFRGLSPQTVFFQLGLGPQDGWQPPRELRALTEAAKKWLKDNAGTYRIQRFVVEKKE